MIPNLINHVYTLSPEYTLCETVGMIIHILSGYSTNNLPRGLST